MTPVYRTLYCCGEKSHDRLNKPNLSIINSTLFELTLHYLLDICVIVKLKVWRRNYLKLLPL